MARSHIAALAALVLVIGAPPRAQAQPPARRVLALKSGALALYDEVLEGFRARVGFRPEERILPEDDEDETAFLEGIRSVDPDLIVALGTRAAEFAQQHFEDTPLLYAMVLDPRELRGPTVRGVMQTVPVVAQLRELKALLPGLRTVGVPYNPANGGAVIKEADEAARVLGIRIEPIRVESKAEAVERVSRYLDDVQALWLPHDSTLINRQVLPAVAALARKARVGLMVVSTEIVRDGVLAALEVTPADAGRGVGEIAVRFLDGEPLAGVREPEVRPHIEIDHEVARELGIPEERVRAAEERYR